jgi:hypothetical protein
MLGEYPTQPSKPLWPVIVTIALGSLFVGAGTLLALQIREMGKIKNEFGNQVQQIADENTILKDQITQLTTENTQLKEQDNQSNQINTVTTTTSNTTSTSAVTKNNTVVKKPAPTSFTYTEILPGGTSTSSQNTPVGKLNTSITLHNVETTNTVSCGYKGCFEEKFAACQPATATMGTQIMGAEIEYYYQIIGAKSGKCEMMFKFTKNPNPDWVNKESICLFDNTKPFTTAFSTTFGEALNNIKTTSCTGSFIDLLRK